jgi:hypothetical protein
MRIAPSGIRITASSLPTFLLDPIKEYIRSNPVQINLHIPTSSYAVQLEEDNISVQDNMAVDSSNAHDEQAAVATAMENAPYDVKSWLPVLEDVDVWDDYEATVANMCLDTASVSVDLENENMDVDVDVANPQTGVEDVGDKVVDVAGNDTGEMEASEEEEDDGTVVVQAQPAVVQTLPILVHVPFLTAIPNRSGGPGGRGKLFFITFHPILI